MREPSRELTGAVSSRLPCPLGRRLGQRVVSAGSGAETLIMQALGGYPDTRLDGQDTPVHSANRPGLPIWTTLFVARIYIYISMLVFICLTQPLRSRFSCRLSLNAGRPPLITIKGLHFRRACTCSECWRAFTKVEVRAIFRACDLLFRECVVVGEGVRVVVLLL